MREIYEELALKKKPEALVQIGTLGGNGAGPAVERRKNWPASPVSPATSSAPRY